MKGFSLNTEHLKRVMIIGQPGSGKSTLAREIGEITGLPVVHIDKIHWQSGWVERPKDEKTRLCQEVHARDQWVFEGGHSSTWQERVARADMLVWLDIPLWIRCYRVAWRTLRQYGQTRADLPEGCPERFSVEFYQWIWDTRHSAKESIDAFYRSAPPDKAKFRLSSASQVQKFLLLLKR